MIVLVALGSFFVFSGSVAAVDLLPVVGLLLLAGQKILPIMQVFYGSYSNLVGGARSLEDAIEMMEAPKCVSEAVSEHLVFKEAIKFCNVGLKYFQRPLPTLSDINLTIKKGECIGIVGKTGCGKSTLANIFLGLLWPSEGYVEVDGKQLTSSNVKSWQGNTAYVAQDVFLSDATICKNVAFGAYDWEIDLDEVHQALNGAMLQDLMSSLPNGIETCVGERGVQLSGGQRQRLGIARALYRKSDILVLDEASSALDNETELAIMQTIAKLKERMTILIVAHRHTSLMACDRIIMLEDGAVVRTGTPAEILGNEKL
jgi:ATP-binding cassette subfamily B protein